MFILIFSVCLPAAETGNISADSLAERRNITSQDRWIAKDKVHHLAASAFLTGFGYYAANKEMQFSCKAAQNFSVTFSFSFGLLKECYDGTYGKSAPSYKDIVADLAGIGIGLMLLKVETNN
ncbi:MAG TPA: hypothetical protein PLP19_01130 [bacterium]|nr:hypothetical protein [bacterium]HPN42066.1 hypothetical protein [bacterium]